MISNKDSQLNSTNLNKLFTFKFPILTERFFGKLDAAPEYIKKYKIFTVSFLFTIIFYLPALHNNSINAGLLYTGDVLGYYLPALMKTHSLISSHHFTAINYSLFNGSSDFFLSPNFFAVHPLLVLYSLVIPFENTSMQSAGHFLVLLLAIHSFLACYFSIKLAMRYFDFEFRTALLIGSGFAFSSYMINAVTQPPFLFCASIVPWATYAALRYSETKSFSLLIRGCIPIILGFLGGYLPLGMACLTLSAMLVTLYILFINDSDNTLAERFVILISASLPFFLASIIASPYLYAAFKFHNNTTSAPQCGLFYSAHQLCELPQTIIRIVSNSFSVPGPLYEFSVYWGVIAILITACFFMSTAAIYSLNEKSWKIFKVVGIMYFATVLAIYGTYTPISNLVYYLIPQIGKMHIYQRFLLPAHLLFMIMLGLMFNALLVSRPLKIFRFTLVFVIAVAFLFAFLLSHNASLAQEIGISNTLLFELILGCLFVGMLLIPGKNFVCYGTAILFCLPSLNQMYNLSQGGNTFEAQRLRETMALDSNEQAKLLTYMKQFSNKEIIKYVDITPLWKSGVESFPKDFPHYVLNNTLLSSYGGFTFYLSARADYMQIMPIRGSDVSVTPNWKWLKNTGADFVISLDPKNIKDDLLQKLLNNIKPQDLYKLPNDVVIFPLRFNESKLSQDFAFYNNGYFKVFPATNSKLPTQAITYKNNGFFSNNANYMKLEFEASTPTYIQYLFWNNPKLKYYLNGKRVALIDHNGLDIIYAPVGRNKIEVRYINRPLWIFWLFYAAFGFILLYCVVHDGFVTIRNKLRSPINSNYPTEDTKNSIAKRDE